MKGSQLDVCLSRGYFRTQQEVFTCRFLYHDNRFCPVHWLRIVVPNIDFGPKQRRLFRINEAFSATIRPFALTDELETLYATYRQSIDFDASDSVASCLLNGSGQNRFDTQVIELRDNGKLIAAGIFDNGLHTIAGIMNFYDPAYRRHSPGKYLMLLKMSHAWQQQKLYYYPGYIVSQHPKFDYKLFACEAATEVYDDSRSRWYPFSWPVVNALSEEMLREV
ncbi:GNAT family N-acetyltransferase [Spirosoma montaniterrae]|uniref:Arginine-tRNA-protein transferase n=1 Tax=Spirosoma montaniterrae TaxID=1178516 RepID=A0A1P9WSF1_9BACT|nr:GNAT family N-acetyltransferase [Spirosoma montaniterrae]AQG78315.1 arginine-tRNA-protein transferase [Spirosoma montaniterrae]